MNDEFTRENYWAAVKRIATSAVAEANKQDRPIVKMVDESVQWDRWVIMTYGARKTLEFSENENAFSDLGSIDVDDINNFRAAAAFYAMQQDVLATLSKMGVL